MRHFNAKFVHFIQESRNAFLDEQNYVLAFLQHGINTPVECWFMINALCD